VHLLKREGRSAAAPGGQNMSSSSIRALGRKKVAVLLAVLVAFGSFAVYRTQTSAGAHETQVVLGLTCPLAGKMAVNYTVSHDPLSAVPGAPLRLDVSSTMPPPPANVAGIGITNITITIPVPAEVNGGNIEVMGGNLTKASQSVSGSSATLILNAAAGTTVGTIQMPMLMINMTVKAGVTGPSVCQGPAALSITTNINRGTGPIVENCTADATNPPLVSIPVAAPVTTVTTVAPTTATTVAPTTKTTVAPTTATTVAPTTKTTVAPTTATTVAPTTKTTVAPTTATTVAPTTKTTLAPTTATVAPTTKTTITKPPTTHRPPTENPLLKLIKQILCRVFHIGC
jgi:hypothetical protein